MRRLINEIPRFAILMLLCMSLNLTATVIWVFMVPDVFPIVIDVCLGYTWGIVSYHITNHFYPVHND